MKPHIKQILDIAGVRFEDASVATHRKGVFAKPPGVLMSDALQLFGAHRDLTNFVETTGSKSYNRWQSHHVVGTNDLVLMKVAHLFPERDEQFCVLFPKDLHLKIVHSILQAENERGMILSPIGFRSGYIQAYSMVGNYTGASERMIQYELLRVLRAIFVKMGEPLSKDDGLIFSKHQQ